MAEDFGIIRVNLNCSNDCVFCNFSKKKEYNKHQTEIINNEISILKEALYYYKKGTKKIDVSGNSPLEYKHIIKLIKFLKTLFTEITILDPGNKLENLKLCEDLIKTGIDTIILPIYGSTPKYHNAVTRNENSYNQLIQGIKNIIEIKKKLNLTKPKIELSTLILKQNYENIPELFEFTKKEFGIDIFKITVPYKYQLDKHVKEEDFTTTTENIIETIKKTAPKIENNTLNCFWLPPCLFEESVLITKLKNIRFFNFQIEYDVAKIKEDKIYSNIAKSYLKLKTLPGCEECLLFKEKKCQGTISHIDMNNIKNYPIKNKEILKKIKA